MAKVQRSLSFIPQLKIHPTRLITYNEPVWSPTAPPRKDKSMNSNQIISVFEDGEWKLKTLSSTFLKSSRQGNGYLSSQAKKRLKLAIEYFLHLNKPVNGKSGNSGQHYDKKITFITLTLQSKQIHTDNEIKKECLNQFLIELSRYHKVTQYVWRAEYQKNGNIHFHILANRYIIWTDVRNRWNRIVNKLGYVDRYGDEQREFHKDGFKLRTELLNKWPAEKQKKAYERGIRLNWRDPNSTDIHSIHGITNIKAYLTKYLTKQENTPPKKGSEGKEDKKDIGRLQEITPPEKASVGQEDKKDIGRGWAASMVLSNIKGARTIIDSEIEAQLNHITKHFPDKVYSTDYFSIIEIDLQLIHAMKCTALEDLFNQYILKEFMQAVQLKI